jgi:DNA/RNA endonuclease YhcR with UshA esterase domain
VASSRYLDHSARRPTFLNLDSRPPEHRFTIVIWGKDRRAFGAPEVTLLGRRVCVTGLVSLFKGRPEVVATIPEQLRVER